MRRREDGPCYKHWFPTYPVWSQPPANYIAYYPWALYRGPKSDWIMGAQPLPVTGQPCLAVWQSSVLSLFLPLILFVSHAVAPVFLSQSGWLPPSIFLSLFQFSLIFLIWCGLKWLRPRTVSTLSFTCNHQGTIFSFKDKNPFEKMILRNEWYFIKKLFYWEADI